VVSWVLGCATALTLSLPAGAFENSDYLITHWLAGDGVPGNSALGVAQTPDGYLWVASEGGLLRFDSREFEFAAKLFQFPPLASDVVSVNVDRSGRLWVGASSSVSIGENGVWRTLKADDVEVRSVAEDAQGRVLVGTLNGRVFQFGNGELQPLQAPDDVTRSGVFCCRDEKDGGLWMANRGFIGRWLAPGWKRLGPAAVARDSLVATAARVGGLWVYTSGHLYRYHEDQAVETFPAPVVDSPRQLLEDRQGRLWIASNSRGLVRFERGGGASLSITATNGLAHNSSWSMMEDLEGDLWLATSSGGLHRLRERFFKTIGAANGLPDRIARTVIEEAPGKILVGTHGGGTARIENQQVTWTRQPTADRRGQYVCSLLRDHAGKIWVGTFDGLFVEENRVERNVPVPLQLRDGGVRETVFALMEDSRDRIWVGAHSGLGVIQDGKCELWNQGGLVGTMVRCFAEEPGAGAMWAGTFDQGLIRIEGTNVTRLGIKEGLPGSRITSVMFDQEGNLWAGVYQAGLVCARNGQIVARFGEREGLPALTIGAMLQDKLGFYWMGSDRGLLRVASQDLHALARGASKRAVVQIFNEGDGLANAQCSEGFQPTAVRDAAGDLWFATLDGVVTVNPGAVRINALAPPVVIEQATYRDRGGTQRVLIAPRGSIELPAGSTDLDIRCAALSYAAPGKNRYAFRLEGVDRDWVDLGNRRDIYFPTPNHGAYELRVRGSNNDGLWNENGARLKLTVLPFPWQTWWFRALATLALAGGVGSSVWVVQHKKLLREQMRLDQERALAREQARLASILEGTTDFVAFTSLDGRLLYLNPAGRCMAGIGEKEDVTQVNLRDLQPESVAASMLQTAIPAAIRAGTWTGETQLRRRDGQLIPASQVVVAHKAEQDRVLFLSTIIRDISEQRRAQEALQKSETALRAFMNALPTPALLVAKTGELLAVNDALARALGHRREDLIGLQAASALPPDLLASRQAALEEVFRSSRPVSFEDASAGRYYLNYLSPALDCAGAVASVAMLALDITERQQAELARHRLEARFRSLVENTLDLVAILDPQGVIHFISPSCEALLGYAPEKLIGQAVMDFIHPEDLRTVQAGLGRAFHTGLRQLTEFRIRHADGSWRTMESIGKRLTDEERPMALVNTRDLTERRKLEVQLRHSQKMEAVGQLSGGVAHDFNNILTIIQGHVSLLQGQSGASLETQDSLTEIGQAADRAANLTRQLLAFSRRQVIRPELLDLNDLITSIAKMLQRILGEDVHMRLQLYPQPLLTYADAGMLDQVLMNLAVNARDAMPQGGRLIIETSAQVISQADGGASPDAVPGNYVCLSVSDSGAGMTEEVKAHLFEPFFTTKEPGKGTGLGLATVFGIIKQHQGMVRVYSEMGHGATFRILLPASAAATIQAAQRSEAPQPQGGHETILLVEDDPAVRQLTRVVLSRSGYQVLEAANGPEALKLRERQTAPVHLLLTDMVMPEGMNGRELAAQLQGQDPHLKVIFTSGYTAEFAGRELALREGQNFLQKPSTPRQILEAVRRCLDA